MFCIANRPLATLALMIVLAPSISGCMTTRQLPFNANVSRLDGITGVSMRSGQEIQFRVPGASITNDTMHAVGPEGQLLLPTDSIARVSSRKLSKVRTIGLVSGLAVIGVAIAGAISFGENFQPFGKGSSPEF
jgi:hypothetical protein